MSIDEPDGYLDDIAETREAEATTYPSTRTKTRPGNGGGGSVDEPLPTRSSPNEESPWAVRGKRALRFTRTMLITALVLVGLGGIANIAMQHLPRTSHHTYTYSNVQRIFVAVDGNGSVNVHGTTDGDNVTIKTTDKATLMDPVQRQIISSGGWLVVTVHCPSSECTSDYDLAVPRSTEVRVVLDRSTDQAEIHAQGLDSPVDLYTGHGNVTLADLTSAVHVVANGDVSAITLSGSSIDVFAPIAKSVAVQVIGNPQLVRLTSGQGGKVDLTLPPGGYNISCQPKDNCSWPGSVSGAGGTGPITDDPSSPRLVQVTVNPTTTASIHS
jgi:hypothetical protein